VVRQFRLLQNAIVRGEAITPEGGAWGDDLHIWLGEFRLRQTIKQVVIHAGFPDLRYDRHTRVFHQVEEREDTA
jgi:hypothetical protein